MMFLKNFSAWKYLGLALGLLYPTLERIEMNNRAEDCKMKMLAAWLQKQDNVSQKGIPSWSVLRAALQELGEHQLADRIPSEGQLLMCPSL